MLQVAKRAPLSLLPAPPPSSVAEPCTSLLTRPDPAHHSPAECCCQGPRPTFPHLLTLPPTWPAPPIPHPHTCWVLMSTPDSQHPNPGWLWYQPTTISGLCRGGGRSNPVVGREGLHFFYKNRERQTHPFKASRTAPTPPILYLHLPHCLSMSSILVWNTGSTASTLTPVPDWGMANTSTT